MTRQDLEARWLHLTRVLLPDAAEARAWPVRLDHCFQRILLDNVFEGRWYDHVPRRPAYRHCDEAALVRAITLAETVLAGAADLHELNRRSLGWRGRSR